MAENKPKKITRRYEFEGIVLDVPATLHKRSGNYIEDYPDFIETPMFTAKGMRLMICIEDACEFAKPIEKDRLIDCSDCSKYFQRAEPRALIGFCKNKNMMKKD